MSNFCKMLAFFIALSGLVVEKTYAQSFEWQNISHEIVSSICVLEDRINPQVIYLGTSKGLYKTDNAGLKWKNILRDRDMAINHIVLDSSDAKYVLVATSKGCYCSHDAGATWKNIYHSSNMYEANCRAVFACLPKLYVGTEQGLIVSSDAGVHWNKQMGPLGKNRILGIASDTANDGYIYVAAYDGVYKKKISEGTWEKIYNVFTSETIPDQQEPSSFANDTDESSNNGVMRYICVDPDKVGTVYIATATGVLFSHDSGATWGKLTESGLSAHEVCVVAVGKGCLLCAASKADVFLYLSGSWRRVGNGITAKTVMGLVFGSGHMYAACDTGLFCITNIKPEIDSYPIHGESYTKGIPSIASVQRAAIEYADVDFKKIDQWRRQARNKALLPSVGLGVNRDTSDLWHWESGSTTKEYDDVLRKGKCSYDWDVRLNWDLGQLIWNEQASIDTRARLLVQLRDDVLDEVTKLYFEYVRVRVDMDSISVVDKKKLVADEIRLKELAAQLDGLTNGFFSS